jgi:GTP cyclohydrolase I
MDEKRVAILVEELMISGLKLDMTDPNLRDTPNRIARMFCREFFSSLNEEPTEDLVKHFPNDKGYDEIILHDNIPFTSVCSHHFLPFSGLAWFLYIPHQKLLGASKPARVISFFSKQPELQENLSMEIVNFINAAIEPKGIMLVMRAVHGCMSCRGVKTGLESGLTTSVTTGVFRDNMSTRMEALSLIQLSRVM